MVAAVILKSDPFSWKAIQAYKIATALSRKLKVFFILIREGVYFLTDWSPEELGYENFKSYLFNKDNLIFVVDKDDFEVRDIDKNLLWIESSNIRFLEEKEIAKILKEAKTVGVW